MLYGLPADYRRNVHPVPYDDHAPVTGKCEGWTWQPDVYPLAAELAVEIGAEVIVDVGCGAARKLLPLADRFEVVGIDRGEIVEQINADGLWIAADFESVDPLPAVEVGEPVVWVCSDVVEHLVHPDRLVSALLDVLGDGDRLVLSTPDRPRTRGEKHRGPSQNRGHVQEWALPELVSWLESLGANVLSADYTRSNDHEPDLATCLVVIGSA